MKAIRFDLRGRIAACVAVLYSASALAGATLAPAQSVPAGAKSVRAHIAGRVNASGQYQWPGLYFETRFKGPAIYLKTGPGDVILHVSVDGAPVGTLVKPAPGAYLVAGLAATGAHVG